MDNKEKDTLQAWDNCVRFHRETPVEYVEVGGYNYSKLGLEYDFDRLIPYLEIFYDIPVEYKQSVIDKFFGLLFVYLIDNRPMNNIQMHNKIMSKDMYKEIRRDIQVAKDFLNLINSNKIKLNNAKSKIQKYITEQETLISQKAVTKLQMKQFLKRVNTKFDLKKSFEIKEFVDAI